MITVLRPAPQTKTISSPARRPAPRSGARRHRTSTDPGERRIWLILVGTLVLAAFCVGMFLQKPRFRHTDTPISEIQLGANVPGSNPSEADDLTFGDSIDPDTWKMVRLTAQQGDGTLVEISLLRPDSWLAERSAVVGSVIDGLEFGRLGVVGDATVETIAACPPIRPGPGRTVTGIYRHFGQQVLDLRTANGEEIGVTPDHRFWSADRREFVPAGDLHPGETLNLLDGTTTVTSIRQRPSGEPVYTLEVHVEHVFHVAKSGVLVHNCGSTPNTGRVVYRELSAMDRARLDQGLGLLPKGTGGSIADHVAGNSTRYISASEAIDATRRFRGGHGLAEIDVDKAIKSGAGFVDHKNVLQGVSRNGLPRDVKNATSALEVLFKDFIPSDAIRIIP